MAIVAAVVVAGCQQVCEEDLSGEYLDGGIPDLLDTAACKRLCKTTQPVFWCGKERDVDGGIFLGCVVDTTVNCPND